MADRYVIEFVRGPMAYVVRDTKQSGCAGDGGRPEWAMEDERGQWLWEYGDAQSFAQELNHGICPYCGWHSPCEDEHDPMETCPQCIPPGDWAPIHPECQAMMDRYQQETRASMDAFIMEQMSLPDHGR